MFELIFYSRENGEVPVRGFFSARLTQNLTQKQLAEKSGVRQSNISRIENGTASPTVVTIQALANGIGKKLVISFG